MSLYKQFTWYHPVRKTFFCQLSTLLLPENMRRYCELFSMHFMKFHEIEEVACWPYRVSIHSFKNTYFQHLQVANVEFADFWRGKDSHFLVLFDCLLMYFKDFFFWLCKRHFWRACFVSDSSVGNCAAAVMFFWQMSKLWNCVFMCSFYYRWRVSC